MNNELACRGGKCPCVSFEIMFQNVPGGTAECHEVMSISLDALKADI